MTTVTVTSFGFLHAPPPTAHLTIDLRTHFRDPHVNPALRHMTAHDPAVRQAVLATPGIAALLDGIEAATLAFLSGPSTAPLAVATGCAGGRHRAATIALTLADRLTARGIPTSVTHRDLARPVVERNGDPQ